MPTTVNGPPAEPPDPSPVTDGGSGQVVLRQSNIISVHTSSSRSLFSVVDTGEYYVSPYILRFGDKRLEHLYAESVFNEETALFVRDFIFLVYWLMIESVIALYNFITTDMGWFAFMFPAITCVILFLGWRFQKFPNRFVIMFLVAKAILVEVCFTVYALQLIPSTELRSSPTVIYGGDITVPLRSSHVATVEDVASLGLESLILEALMLVEIILMATFGFFRVRFYEALAAELVVTLGFQIFMIVIGFSVRACLFSIVTAAIWLETLYEKEMTAMNKFLEKYVADMEERQAEQEWIEAEQRSNEKDQTIAREGGVNVKTPFEEALLLLRQLATDAGAGKKVQAETVKKIEVLLSNKKDNLFQPLFLHSGSDDSIASRSETASRHSESMITALLGTPAPPMVSSETRRVKLDLDLGVGGLGTVTLDELMTEPTASGEISLANIKDGGGGEGGGGGAVSSTPVFACGFVGGFV